MGFNRGDSFPFDFEPNGIPFGSKSKGKLSPRSYPIQFERKGKQFCECIASVCVRVLLFQRGPVLNNINFLIMATLRKLVSEHVLRTVFYSYNFPPSSGIKLKAVMSSFIHRMIIYIIFLTKKMEDLSCIE